MKRDMDVVRKIVLAVHEAPLGSSTSQVDGVDAKVFAAHAQLLMEAGLVQAALLGADKNNPQAPMKRIPESAIIYRLTWSGQDFADAIRDETLWNRVRSKVIKPAGSWTFGVLLDVLKSEIVTQIANP